MATPELQEFFAVLRGGDPESIRRLLDEVEPILRRIIHLRLIDGRLHHIADTSDILQSLLKDFLCQEGRGRFPGPTMGGLRAYLTKAVLYKILRRAREERRHPGSLHEGLAPVSPEPPADRHVDNQDHAAVIRARFPATERKLLDLWSQGLTWAEIARQVGGRPDTLRIRLDRAIAKVLDDLNHEE